MLPILRPAICVGLSDAWPEHMLADFMMLSIVVKGWANMGVGSGEFRGERDGVWSGGGQEEGW